MRTHASSMAVLGQRAGHGARPRPLVWALALVASTACADRPAATQPDTGPADWSMEDVWLKGLTVSRPGGAEPLELGLVPGTLAYRAEMSVLQSSTRLTATAMSEEARITVAGMPVGSGTPSPEMPLALGDNDIDVVVTHPRGGERVYRVTVARAARLAERLQARGSNTGVMDGLGYSVAVSGDLVAVGAPGEDSAATGVDGAQDDDSAVDSGAVYVFRQSGSTWVQEAYLKASNPGAFDDFGVAVALSGDTLAVAADLESSAATGVDGAQDDDSALHSGAVYVFRKSGSTWAQEAYLKASNTESYDRFGTSLALSGDTLAVGADLEDSAAAGVDGNQADGSAADSGAVYVFRRSGSTWAQEAYLKASNPDARDYFGRSVALDGDFLAVGAPGESSAAIIANGDQSDNSVSSSGAVYVFRRSGSTWAQEAYLKASYTGPGFRFGQSVALAGEFLAVGVPGEDSAIVSSTVRHGTHQHGAAPASGAVYVFHRIGGRWFADGYLKASNHAAEDYFGQSVALVGDLLAVGADGEDSAATGVDGAQDDDSAPRSGAVYLFQRQGFEWWTQHAYIKASGTDSLAALGWSVALSDGILAITAPYAALAAGTSDRSGALYLFH